MKTWEMIKKLTENHDKEFISTKYEEVVYYDNFGEIIYKDNTTFVLDKDTLYDTWTEVIELVDFLTAYKDCEVNGTEYKGYTQTMYRSKESGLVIILCKTGHSNAILCNEWKKVSNDNN